MATHTKCLRLLFALTIALLPPVLHDALAAEIERIRSETPLLNGILTTAYDRSAMFRSLVERIERSDVIVHLTCDRFNTSGLSGRTVLASASPGVRYLRVQIRCQQDDASLVAIVAHELQHVAEIAASSTVVDERSFAHLFGSIGFTTCLSLTTEQFETTAALETGTRIRAEFFKRATRALDVDHRDRRARRAWPSDGRSGTPAATADGE
jgi:hypothetical protein